MENENIIGLNFGVNVPTPYESRNTSNSTYVQWGLDNLYPNFLLKLYMNSGVHQAIVNQKSTYIIGEGLQNANKEPLTFKANAIESIDEVIRKAVKDFVLYNSFAIEFVYNGIGEVVELIHVPVHQLRMNREKTLFFHCEDWINTRKYNLIKRFNPYELPDSTSRLFFYDGYFPSPYLVYPQPEYAGIIKSLMIDEYIQVFNLNTITNNFSPATLINIYEGRNLSHEVKRQTKQAIEKAYTGADGQRVFINFTDKDGKAIEISNLSAADWINAYNAQYKVNMENIMIGHGVQNPALFGLKTEGQLGNTNELEASYQMFQNNYVSVKRQELIAGISAMLRQSKMYTQPVEFGHKPLFNDTIGEQTKEKILTINELRKLAGFEPLADKEVGDKLIAQIQKPTIVPAGMNDIVQPEVKKKACSDGKCSHGKDLKESDFELIKHLGSNEEEFEVIDVLEFQFDKESDIADWLINNNLNNQRLGDIVDVLSNEVNISTTEDEVQNILDKLTKAGMINVEVADSGRINIKSLPAPQVPETDKVFTMYRYQKRPEASGDILLPTSRSFCRKVVESKKLYSLEDIQTMESIFGYDIKKLGGGYWYNPETEETKTHCRHYWQSVKVKRKK